MLFRISIILILTLCFSCNNEQSAVNSDVQHLFSNPESSQTGISFKNTLSENDSLNILDYLYFYNGGGVAIGDINNDSLPDIYFTGNQVTNKLYLNKGNLQFEDITQKAGVCGESTWNTGTIMFDANQDGLLDIYVRAVVGINNFVGHDELFINNGDLTFSELSSTYGLDYQSYGTTAALLDYDKDGDLDIYQLNHAVHTQESFGNANLRLKRNSKTGDRLLRNDSGVFTDVSEKAGIFGGINGYGLGVSIADFNQDGWPDIYVGNDFHEDDYYYINLKNGSFRESLKENFGHTSRFSMGNDTADINNDGYSDIISLDMLPNDEKVLKSSEGDDNIQTHKMRTQLFGYHYQFTRNMLFINQPGYQFEERALSSGVAATDWSWSALFADFDQDGHQDLFISNGIPKRPNNLDFINFLSSDKIQNRINKTRLIDDKALRLMPDGRVANVIFQGNENLNFINKSSSWITQNPSVSGATALSDLDNDGDLDLVVNNINEEASLYINQTDTTASWLKIKLDYRKNNKDGIGTKIYLYHNGKLQYKELYTARGFQASSEPIVHFGLGTIKRIDSIKVFWPDNTFQKLQNVFTNQKLTIKPHNTLAFDNTLGTKKTTALFSKVEDNLGISYSHKEDAYIDFNRQKLIPYQVSDRGPAVAIGDLNQDGINDIYFGSSKFISSEVFYGGDTAFAKAKINLLTSLSKTEDVTATILKDKIFVGTAGADFPELNPALKNYKLSIVDSSSYPISPLTENTSTLIPNDYDQDGDQDFFVGNHMITGDFGKRPSSYLLKNNEGLFSVDLKNSIGEIGMVTHAIWSDFSGDGIDDLIIVGEWMQPAFYKNLGGTLIKANPLSDSISGLWQSIQPFDMDNDGDMDYLLGNWGTNSKFTASKTHPLYMYYGDIDKNGQTESIIAIEKNGSYYPIQNLTELSEQLVYLKKKYKNNNEFSGQTIKQIFGDRSLKNLHKLEVTTLTSGYLKNNNGKFAFVAFPLALQVAPIMDFVTYDFTGDGNLDVLAGGNYFGTKPYHGRLDSFSGALIKSDNTVTLGYKLGLDLAQKSVRHLNIIAIHDKKFLLVTFNNEKAQVYSLKNDK